VKEVKVKNGQTLIDICVQELGDSEQLLVVAQLNGLGVTDLLTSGQIIEVPDFALDKKAIVKVFTDPALAPASDKGDLSEVLPEGLEFWSVEFDFVVS